MPARRHMFLLAAMLMASALPVTAAITVRVAGPGGSAEQVLPDAGGPFDVNLPLAANAQNEITVTARDAKTNEISARLQVTQLSLQSVVVASIRTEPLPPQRVEELVNSGAIQLDDPSNFNVSQFIIILTIGGEPVSIDIPVGYSIAEPQTGFEIIKMPKDPGGGGGNPPKIQDQELIIFEQPVFIPGIPEPLRIPGVIVIEGRIKTLKEFFSVRLLMMNTSGIFTLQDVTALLSFPDGGLSHTLPIDGLISFESILPGDGNVPGQKEREFIIRGDEIGVRRVRVDFGGSVIGPGIDASNAVPFNGSAESTVEVKGPPNFLVEVVHPDTVSTNNAYELVIKITNSGQTPALYTSLDLDLGLDAMFVDCTTPTNGSSTTCSNIPGPVTRSFGHIFPGEKVSVSYLIKPLRTGPISSCLGISDQNITLRVSAGLRGCLIGQFPPTRGVSDGIPDVTVAPLNNTMGVNPQQPIVAFFSELMDVTSITTGTGGTFNVFTASNSVLPGVLRFDTVFDRTVAVWQYFDGISTLMPDNQLLTVYLTQGITDPDGNPIFNEWVSTFRTTSLYNDNDPPQVDMLIEPPVDPNFVLPGQIMTINVHLSDQGSGPERVELYQRDLTATNALFTQVDQKMIFQGSDIPARFAVDTATLEPGHTYLYKASAIDRAGNVGEATIVAILAATADPPVLVLPEDPTNAVLQGIAITMAPVSISGGVKRVEYYLDGTNNNVAAVFLPPFQTTLGTLSLPIGAHTVTAVAVDGLNQIGSDELVFNLVTNVNEPQVSFDSGVSGGQFLTGEVFSVSGRAEDPTGIESVQFFLNDLTNQIAAGTQPFLIDTTGLATGDYEVIILASNKLGRSNNTLNPESRFKFSVIAAPPAPPPPAPNISNVTEPDDGTIIVTGSSIPGAVVTIVNTNIGFTLSVVAATNGSFIGSIDAVGGHVLSLTAFHAPTSPSNSFPALVVVPPALIVTNLLIVPDNRTFTAAGQFQDFTVTAQLDSGGTSNVTARSSFSSSEPSIASVNQSGRMVAQYNGLATLTAAFKTNTAQAAINVDIVVLTNFTVSISNPLLVFPGDTASISVTGQYSNGSSAPIFSGISYGVANLGIVNVNGSGLVTALAEGNTTISVAVGGLPPKQVSVGVAFGLNPPPTVSFVNPPNGALVERGQIVSVNVQAIDPTGGVTRVVLTSSGELVSSNEQNFGVTPNTTRNFNLGIPIGAPIGGTITFHAWAVDVGGMVSATQSISVTVADLTAPAVSILAPTNGQSFNAGSTVTVVVLSVDAVGVGEVRYSASGAITLSGSLTNAYPLAATNTFSFIVPPGAPIPDVYLTAFARDAAGNERTSTLVQILLTGADITPPATIITSASAPGSSTSNIVSYAVTDGFADLNYVQIYFRRNGIGTFNLYTETSGTNILGRYFPQSGTNGTVVFDSTQMGGDGLYEFYSVGVDQFGNREATPTNADEIATFSAGTVWVNLTSSTNISASNFTFDNVNLRISNALVTIEGAHNFRNVELLGTAMITHAEATVSNEPVFHLTLWSLSMTTNASINVTGRGYLGGQQAGNPFNQGLTTNNTFGSNARAGGSHGGLGGIYLSSVPCPIYGNLQQPTELGSGGGSRGDSAFIGGDGGGRIRISAINIAADGNMRADGNVGTGFQAGGGSGGSIFLITRSLSGAGLLTANGGGNEVGGGGGRISIHHTDLSTKDSSLIRALGFDGPNGDGGNGTVFLKGPEELNGTLVIDGQGVVGPFNGLPIPVGVTFDNIILRNNARVVVDDPIVVGNSLEVRTGAVLTHTTAQTNGLHITARNVIVDATSAIDVTGRGYRGGHRDGRALNEGETLGGQSGALVHSGGSYGGLGGIWDGAGSNLVYGTPYDPIYLGAGGSSRGDSAFIGGNGGGRITMVVSNSITVLGAIRADGQAATGFQAGGGAGGSIKILTSLFQGTGSVTANGGGNEVGGGGGRILVVYDLLGLGSNDFNGVRNVTATGFKGSNRHSSSGSILMRQSAQAFGDLIVDAATTNATAQLWSPLNPIGLGRSVALTTNTLTLDGAVVVLPGGLVGLKLKPNVNHPAEFTIVDNTTTTITVDVSSGTNLSDVAVASDVYAALYRFDNVVLRRGAWLVTSDRLVINNSLWVTENSELTHFMSKTNYEPGLEIVADAVTVSSNSAINVDGRGYLGGQQGGNPMNEGRALNNTTGSTSQAGGSHGGIGGIYLSAVPGTIYGSITTPTDLGAGGGSRGDSLFPGGNGGGRIRVVAETVTVHGVISANGLNAQGFQAGSGSGGSIQISATTIEGDGVIRANGGVNEVAGSGGRVAFYYENLTMISSNIQALGGDGSNSDSGHGTIFLKSPAEANGTLVIDGANVTTPEDSTPLPPGYVFDNIVLRNRARVLADVPVIAVDTVSLTVSSRMSHTRGYLPGLVVTSAHVIVDISSAFDVSAKGYRGGQRAGFANNWGETIGSPTGSQVFAGGSYGGRGAVFSGPGANPVYGIPAEPVWLGSGGSSRGDLFFPGGNGGGRITLTVSGTLTMNGGVLANGQSGSGFQSGSGSGGSVLLRVGTLAGTGVIQANGGVFEVGGGGGRIAVFYTNLMMGVTNISATGGDGIQADAGHGTVLLTSNTQTNGDLIVDGYGFATVSDSTPIPTNVVFDNVMFRNGARIQLVEPLIVLGSVQVISNAVITHPLSQESGLRIEAGSLFIGTNSAIDVTGRGYRGGQRDGNATNPGLTTNNAPGSTVRSGGSHGGLGGSFSGGVPNPTYGSVTNPIQLGSGGSSRGDSFFPGGNGGGRIMLVATNSITVHGAIRSDGQSGTGFQSGGGSGGSIKIFADSLSGDGTIEADGGGTEVGGGGGRIAVYVNTLAFATNRVTAAAGPGANGPGSPGTVYFGVAPVPFGLFGLPSVNSIPALTAARVNGQQVVVVWDVGNAEVYAVQFSPDLMPSSWTTLQYLVNPVWTGTLPVDADRGFIRIIQEE